MFYALNFVMDMSSGSAGAKYLTAQKEKVIKRTKVQREAQPAIVFSQKEPRQYSMIPPVVLTPEQGANQRQPAKAAQ